jgi:N-methylhydantoinase B
MHCQDGMDAVQCHMTNTRNAPVEVIESTYPLFVKGYGLVPDTEGAGRFRGGLGMYRAMEIESPETTLTLSSDRAKLPPWGVFDGKPGGTSRCLLASPDGRTETLAYSKTTRSVAQGDTVTIITPGGGGWGDPLERDPASVLWDLQEELISAERARSVYGVVIEPGPSGQPQVNLAATQQLRTSARLAPAS